MPKKSRRAKARRRAAVAKVAQEGAVSQQAGPLSADIQSPARVSPRGQIPKAQIPKAQDLAGRYRYVVPELKRIGIIAGAIVVVLIILSFILS